MTGFCLASWCHPWWLPSGNKWTLTSLYMMRLSIIKSAGAAGRALCRATYSMACAQPGRAWPKSIGQPVWDGYHRPCKIWKVRLRESTGMGRPLKTERIFPVSSNTITARH